jgi:5'-nucleotidase
MEEDMSRNGRHRARPGLVRYRSLAAVPAALLGLTLLPAAQAHAGPAGASLTSIQLLAINDFHGHLEPPQGSTGSVTVTDPAAPNGPGLRVPAGGVEYLATHLRAARAGQRHTATVAAGDLIGASPLLSGAFRDEPTVLAMNTLGLDVSSVGNHEFDEGKNELMRMQHGGCHPVDGCAVPGRRFPGASFPYLAANVTQRNARHPLLPPYWIKDFGSARVGFIGMTLRDTPGLVSPEGVRDLTFTDEVDTANALVPDLRRHGVNAIVVLLHEGGLPAGPAFDYDCDAGGPGRGLSGPVVDIARRLDPQIDVLVTGHTHASYVCDIPDPAGRSRLVTSAASFGRLYTDIRLSYDRRSRDIVRSSVAARNVVVTRDVARAADLTGLIEDYRARLAPIANRVVGRIAADIKGSGSPEADTPLGNLVADSHLEATRADSSGGAQLALMNPGGIRTDLTYPASGGEGDGEVTYAEAYAVQPFGNRLVTMDLPGRSLLQALRQQYEGPNGAAPKVLQPAGIGWTVDAARTGADRVVADSVTIGGRPLDESRTYRVTVNEFLAGGGDRFTAFTAGTRRLVGPVDVEAFSSYLSAHSGPGRPLAPPRTGRITVGNRP